METRAVGQHALLVECADDAEVRATYALLRDRGALLGAHEIVPAARTVLVDGLEDPGAAAELMATWEPVPGHATAELPGRLVALPTRYDGPDLDEVARQWDCTTAEVVARHRSTSFVVAFCGFAPGFAYCTGLGPELAVSRRPDPRPRVPAGAVGLAGEYTGVYPTSSPGGWQLIGTTSAALWTPDAADPVLLTPGTRVVFVDD
ncbi:MAG: carboxyltransferase domain-containing protein [Propionibacteriales bacterium]|nr:carboxyltransferase domain-containing protein [Propionibacteriales bacterium]